MDPKMADQAQPNRSNPVETDDNLSRLLVPELEEPFFRSLIRTFRELFKPEKLPPLQVTSKPVEVVPIAVELPWYKSFLQNIKETVRPPKLPPLEVTSKPVPVKDIWGLYGRQKKSFMMSTSFQAAVVAAAFILGSTRPVQLAVKQVATVFLPELDSANPIKQTKPLDGGGGDRSALPASFGKLPKASTRQFAMPVAVYNNMAPKLMMDPSILAPPDAILPQVNADRYGDPFSKNLIPSNGTGSGGGIGNGRGTGVGNGEGGGFGAGNGIFRPGVGGVTQPRPLFRPEPEYSDEARKAKLQGPVVLAIVVTADGKVTNIRVLKSLGLGLDEKAEEAVARWRFDPAKKDGKPVPVEASVEVNFRLL